MKNTIGNLFRVTLFGESHGEAIGVVLDGVPAGIEIDKELFDHQMFLRKPKGTISTQRREKDEVNFVSGLFEDKTTGAPCCMLIYNGDQHSQDYLKIKDVARPSHADYAANVKYGGFQDYRGGGHFSGRLTAPLVAAGAIAIQILKEKGITIGTHVKQLHTIVDDSFSTEIEECKKQIEEINQKEFSIINEDKKEDMIQRIDEARMSLDAVGGVLETCVIGMPAGIGEPAFDSIESRLSHAIFSIGAVKGIEFGLGFGFKDKMSSEVNDEFEVIDGNIVTKTNNNGGINGGISNGMPILFKTVVKPTSSIAKHQKSVNFNTKENVDLEIKGRHDPAIIHRARVVVDSMAAITLVDCLMERYGMVWFQGEKK
ncbi:chorismate synthase [Anaerorhabdus furcosa]|uniref:Chorismate synthase n=1 Tax=Anaerorhabdus furcosa TaxID=118967 RepID=A0A1T4PW90_9FIRM|nr:chorismate synthase [Anaerorhabdus furcosa]SJZ95783.1 chorismate synthase [Anaerorhabdus furcosa]